MQRGARSAQRRRSAGAVSGAVSGAPGAAPAQRRRVPGASPAHSGAWLVWVGARVAQVGAPRRTPGATSAYAPMSGEKAASRKPPHAAPKSALKRGRQGSSHLCQRASERSVRRCVVVPLCQLASGMEESESAPELEEYDISDPTPQNPTPMWSASAQSQAPHQADPDGSLRLYLGSRGGVGVFSFCFEHVTTDL